MQVTGDSLKQIIIGTPLEQPMRGLVRAVRTLLQGSRRLFVPKDINQRYDEQTFSVMKRVLCSTSNCIDVGAHSGEMLREMVRLAPNGNHFAFEPLPRLIAGLRSEYAHMRNVHLFDLVLSDVTGTTRFQHVVSNPAYSGIQKRSYPRDFEQVVEIEVKQSPLDELIPDDVQIDFIKVDVEGAEIQVFKGARRIISRCQPTIVFEHGIGAADYYGTQPGDVFDLLCDECLLQVFLMQDWLVRKVVVPLTREQFVEQFTLGKNYYFMATSKKRPPVADRKVIDASGQCGPDRW